MEEIRQDKDIAKMKADAKVSYMFEKLEKLYPEHKVYAMDAIDKKLRESIANYAKEQGKTAEELLLENGYEMISGRDVYELRHPKQPQPGNEPAVFKTKIENILTTYY